MGRILDDSKTFADATPLSPPSAIEREFQRLQPGAPDDLRRFVLQRFRLPDKDAPPVPAALSRLDLRAHIKALWPYLARAPDKGDAPGSRLALPKPYVLPGGRFRELYYWDSYFTMLGLALDGRQDLVEGMIDDFGALLDRYGRIPNGARTYYLSRSQPPVFYLMTTLSKDTSAAGMSRRLRWLLKEHAFWMRGEDAVKPGQAKLRVARLPDGALVNRYADDCGGPREESLREDIETAGRAGRSPEEIGRELRSAAESGWDFSSRWFGDGASLSTIRVTSISPIDLNSLMFGMEREISRLCSRVPHKDCAKPFSERAERRRMAVERHFWDPYLGVYKDLDLMTGEGAPGVTAAAAFPLFVGLASPAHGRAAAARLEKALIASGGLRTTARRTGQQWDAPNGWAPLQWVAYQGLRRYGRGRAAELIRRRWLQTVKTEYAASGRLLEKYDVEHTGAGRGGEYPAQDGFGWTNGVVRAFLELEPPKPAPLPLARSRGPQGTGLRGAPLPGR
jgi:alpha,alpha-trehalase